MQIKRILLLAPVAFWIFQVVVFLLRNIYLFLQGSSGQVFDIMLHTFPIDCLTFCVFYFFFAPRFYSRKHLRLNIFLVVVFFLLNSGLWVLYYYLLGTNDAAAELVPAEKEISYIRSYLDLQKLRYRDPGFVDFSAEPIATGVMIPPLLFIPFIENAFKHGSKSASDKIVIEVAITGTNIRFYCRNTKRELTETEQRMDKGIGIGNIRRRLELLYPGMHRLEISDKADHYTGTLTIETNENQVHRH